LGKFRQLKKKTGRNLPRDARHPAEIADQKNTAAACPMANNAKEGTKLGTVSGHLEISFVLSRRICKGDFGPVPKTGSEGPT